MEQFFTWSEQNLGQSHYVLGYLIVLISHNWPIMVALIAALMFSIRLYREASRANAVWLFTALLFGLGYEYEKHVAVELHHAIDVLFGLEIAHWNRPLHLIVGPVINTGFVIITIGMAIHGLQLSFGPRILKMYRRSNPARIPASISGTGLTTRTQGDTTYERAGDTTDSPSASPRRQTIRD